MAYSTDRLLLSLEPTLFRDIAWSAQTRLTASDAAIASTTLTSASSDFTAAQIAPGMVALVNDAPLEIVEVLSPTALTVSRLRDDEHDDPIAPLPMSGASLRISTFGPQRAIVHRQLLAALGLDEQSASSVTNPHDLALVEALGALHLILSSAAALVGDASPLWAKAALYRERFDRARRTLAAHLDLNADGLPDATRRITVVHLLRA
ncbi:MAG: hypothetical protein KF684_10850 [Phycisphaeraceae bacterium]|nr:hypothetical protein [Phycisphaeraceae bacterium]